MEPPNRNAKAREQQAEAQQIGECATRAGSVLDEQEHEPNHEIDERVVPKLGAPGAAVKFDLALA